MEGWKEASTLRVNVDWRDGLAERRGRSSSADKRGWRSWALEVWFMGGVLVVGSLYYCRVLGDWESILMVGERSDGGESRGVI